MHEHQPVAPSLASVHYDVYLMCALVAARVISGASLWRSAFAAGPRVEPRRSHAARAVHRRCHRQWVGQPRAPQRCQHPVTLSSARRGPPD